MSSFSDIRSGLLKKYNVRPSDEEDRKETKSTTTVSAPDTTSDFYSIRENLLGKYSQENVTQRRQAVSDWTSRYNKVMENLSSGFGDSGKWKTGQDMDSMEVEIGSLLRDYEDIREYADRAGLPNAFRYANELKKLQEDMPQYRDYFGQWDSQESYDAFLAEQREIQAKRNLNLSDYQTQIDRKMQTLQRFQNQQGKSGGNQEKIQALEDEIQDMVVYQRQAEFLQRRDRLEAVTESPDFAQGSQYTQDGDDRILYDYINNPDGYRDRYNQDRERLNLLARNPDLQYGGLADVAGLEDGSEDPFQLKGYDLLTDEEIAVYNYYYSTQGSEAARNYLETIQEDLNYRVAINRFQQGYQGNTANGLLYGIEAGVNQAQTGLVNALDAVTGKSDYIPLSSKQILSSLVRDDLAESGWRMPDALGGASLGQAAYDLITTSANMAPSILTSLAVNYIAPGWGSAVGAAMMAGSAAGNAYQEALNAGYGKDRARTYALLIGISEGALQYVLGGINALGGKVSGNAIAKALSKVENGLLRAAGQIGGNMLSEGTEEAIQEVLDPIFRNIILGTDEDVDWEQVAYSGVLGAVTGGIFEGAGMLLNQNANTRSRAGRDSQIPGQSALGSDTSTPGPTSDGVNVEQDTVNPQQADVPTFQETVSPEQEIQIAPEEVETEAPEPVSVPESNVEEEEAVQSSKTISEVAQQYGNQAGAVEQIYRLGSEDQSIDTFEREFGLAYDMGKSGVSESYAMQSQGTQSLTEQQRQFAFQTGQAAAQALAKTQASQNQAAANGKTGWRKGVVKGEGVSIADLTQTFNDPQRTAYKTLSTIAEATGIDIVLYKSQTDANGNFQGAQGKFKWSENAIYIDVNAGLSNVKDVGELSKYTMLRTFNHEFTHFIEKWNPEQYNEFRSTVFDALTEQGENVEDLIDMKLAQDSGGTMTYDMAAREVVAEAMTDILPDSNFVERLASQNRTLFETLLSKIKEFLANIKSYFSKLAGNPSREAKALKKQMGDTVSYLENIVKMFDDAAVKAVETYQATVAEDTQVEKKAETVEAKPKQETKQAEKPKAPAKNKTREGQKTNTSVSPENQKLTSTADTPSTVVKSLDLNYQKISPSLSVFTDSGNGAYLLYDDNTITPSEVIFHQLNSMDGWTAQGVFYLFRPVMDGKSVDTYKQSELDGFYRIDRVVKRAKLRKVGSTFILDNAGIIEIADYKKPVRSDNSTILKVEKSAVQQEISSQDLKSSEGPKIQDKERKPTEAPAVGETQAPEYRSSHGFTIRTNAQYGSLEISFDGKPDAAIRDVLKDHKFRWNGKKGVWYGKADQKTIVDSLNEAYEKLDQTAAAARAVEPQAAPVEEAREAMVTDAEKQTSDTTVTRKNGTDKPTNAAVQLPKMDSSSNVQTVESSVKLEDFGEKIGGARKDLWNSRGLLVDDLSQMNDRERSKAVKKDNVWKRPDYRKLVEGGESRGILYARNEIRKALNQNITYPYSTGDGTQSPQYLERVRGLQEDFISTVRDIQKLAEQAKSAEDFQNMGRPWLKEHGFLTETNGRDHYTEKWRKNPALKGTDYVITVEYLARNFSKLDALAEKKGFAADAKTQVPKGYSIHQDTLEDGTWFVAKGSYILRHHIPSYEDALTFLKQLSDTRKRKTRFVPQQLLEVHRKGPDYRSGKNVSGQDYLDTFGFRGGEFGNWLNEKDRQVSLNYGFDALKDLADALQIADGDISLGGNLSIAFGARGQGLSGAAAHYEPERHVINLTKMKGAGSLAHEWFHALDDYVGGYQEKMATDNQRNLPETTKAAVRNLITTMQYRDATQEETDLAASKRYEQARRSVTYQVDEMFRWVEKLESGRLTEGETKYFARKPTMEDAQKYHALLNRLLDTGDAAVIEELSDFRKGIYGRVIPKENREAIGYRLFPLKPDANKNVQKMRQYTDFYTNSRRFNDLYQKDGDYWDSTVEMAARAFACYVADKTGANNDYLSAHSDSAVGFDVGKNGDLTVIKAFPEGQERTDINAAFDQLIAALKDDGFLHIQERTEKPGMIQYQDRKQMEKGDHYGEGNEGRRAGSRQTDSPGLARGEDSGFGGQSLGSVSAGNQWERIGAEQRSQIINQLDLYTYDNPESEFYLRLFEDGDLSDLDVHMNAISNMAQQFYEAMQGNRILLENDPRFRWLGDSLSLFIQDVESILSGSFTPVTDEEFQARTHTFSDREILEIAADDLRLDELTEGERDALRIFRDRLSRLHDLQEQRADLGTLYREQQFGANGAKVDRAEAEKTRNRMQVLDSQIEKARSGVLDVENKAVLRRVLQSARKVVEQKQKDADTAMLRRWRDRRNNAEAIRKYRKRIEKDTAALLNMLGHPTKDAHVPLSLQKPLQELLDTINFDSKSKLMGKEITVRDVSYTRALQNMRSAVAAQQMEAEGAAENGFSLDVPPDFIAKIDEHIATINSETKKMNLTTNRVYEMTSSDLEALSSLLRTINKSIRSIDKLHMEGAKARVSDLGKSTMAEMRGQNAVKGESGNTAVWSMLTPIYAFERMGTAASQIFDGLRQGQAKLAWNVESVIRFARNTFTVEEVRNWEHHIHQIELSSGENIRMSDAQIMSFYCLSKRNHAMGHFMGGGIRIGTISKGEAGTIRKDIVQKKSYLIYPEDISKINDLLTQRQRAVAGALQRYMQTAGGSLVNEISMARWDYLAAVEENYFPIATDDTTRDTRNPGQDKSNLWSLLNKSFTKGLQENARNAVVVNSIFDVFADHMSETTEYNAFALPLVDAMRWFNYTETSSVDGTHIKSDGVRKSIQDTLGTAAVKYFVDLMTDINSSQKAGRHEDFMGRLLSRSKASAVGWNLRVAIQQPSAILDASLYLDLGYLLKGAARVKTKQLVEEMQKYSGIAMWKSLGYYDLNVARSVKSQIKGDTGFLDRMNEAGMWLPGKMDEITWARIWAACKEKVKNEQKLSGEELLHQTANLFENVVYHTQVVDSVLTRSSIMRSKSGLIKDATSFMAEPIKKLNILMSTQQDYKAGEKTWGTASKIMRKVFFGFVLGSIANALLASIGDALRDDDEYEDFLDKYRQALWGENFFDGNLFSELNPLEKVVFVRDVLSLLKGYDVNNPYIEVVQAGINLLNNLKNHFEGKGSITGYGLIYQSLRLVGNLTGAAPANVLREAVSIWNSTFGILYPDMLIHQYDSGDRDAVRNAYLSGTLPEEEAIQELLSKGVEEDWDDASWTVQKWAADENLDEYYRNVDKDIQQMALTDQLYYAVTNGETEFRRLIEETYRDQRAIDSAMVTGLKDNDSRIIEAAEKQMEGDILGRQQIADKIASEGLFSSYLVSRAWKSAYNELQGESTSEYSQDFDTYTIQDYFTAAYNGDDLAVSVVYEYLAEQLQEEHYLKHEIEDSLASSFASQVKNSYMKGETDEIKATALLKEYGGRDSYEAETDIKKWDFELEYGYSWGSRARAYRGGDISENDLIEAIMEIEDESWEGAEAEIRFFELEMENEDLDITASEAKKYFEYGEPAGISAEQFLEGLEIKSNATGTDSDGDGEADSYSVVKEVLPKIGRLNLTAYQKTEMAKALGWSEKTINRYKTW